jgi:hypothetical protein
VATPIGYAGVLWRTPSRAARFIRATGAVELRSNGSRSVPLDVPDGSGILFLNIRTLLLWRWTMKKVATCSADHSRSDFTRLEQLPNVGPSVAADFKLLGVARPQDLLGRDPYTMYDELCRVTKQRHDPCLLDTFIAAVRFMGGEPARPWWAYTPERKRALAAREKEPRTA